MSVMLSCCSLAALLLSCCRSASASALLLVIEDSPNIAVLMTTFQCCIQLFMCKHAAQVHERRGPTSSAMARRIDELSRSHAG